MLSPGPYHFTLSELSRAGFAAGGASNFEGERRLAVGGDAGNAAPRSVGKGRALALYSLVLSSLQHRGSPRLRIDLNTGLDC